MPEISVLIEAGKATAAAPLGPALGPLGVNIGDIVNQINEKTKDYAGMKVPVKISVDSNKNFEISIGSPPTSALIKKELGLDKASDNPKTTFVGSLTMDQVKKVADMKIDNLVAYSEKSAMKEVIGTCNSMGIQIDDKPAKKVQREIRHGEYSSYFEKIGEKGTEELTEEELKKDALDVEEERSEAEKQKYLDEHPELRKELEAEEQAEKAEEAKEEKPEAGKEEKSEEKAEGKPESKPEESK
ncbi:MAG: 50S ribosomal protein L11 [Candidatus Diapherotrites archaeon]|uniref:Large ribosomal subunit protein uL11 n=1 Tax=Candidatus Iainarchaeum sp. TaxID=3101447 RepID=A0A2D6M115_9ARCH|nr:50S ribosomal protein L11 [Candidatus Diapherotrites archaeon]